MEPQHIFLIFWVIMAATMLTVMYKRGKKALDIFPDISSVHILFREKGVSGNSRKSLKTKLGGARNVLEIIVTNDELWIRSPLLFAGFGKTYDLLHKVQLLHISNAELNKKNVVITFNSTQKTETTLDLKMKKAQEFVEIINKKSV
ncbi:hypothetical protein, partial [Formosa algae]|uniref:hypothetical protein n=1 Tax=Formosa algae TaxID=225843 RepID=UPI0011AFAE5A